MKHDQLHHDLATIGRNAIDKIIAMRDALENAKYCILIDRTALADAHMNEHSNRIDDDGLAALAEYDKVLSKINAALGQQVEHSTDSCDATPQKWIPVSVAKPPIGLPVWLYEPGRGIWTGARGDTGDGWLWGNTYGSHFHATTTGGNGRWQSHDNKVDDDYMPTHWMELPTPPNSTPQAPTNPPTPATSGAAPA